MKGKQKKTKSIISWPRKILNYEWTREKSKQNQNRTSFPKSQYVHFISVYLFVRLSVCLFTCRQSVWGIRQMGSFLDFAFPLVCVGAHRYNIIRPHLIPLDVLTQPLVFLLFEGNVVLYVFLSVDWFRNQFLGFLG